jgi:hypothetical protein
MNTTPPTITELVAEITKSFDSLPLQLERGRSDLDWTTLLKESIGNLGEKHQWSICASGFEGHFECEWLYDLIWYREGLDGHLAEVYLVLESEWGKTQSDIKFDFEKLLLAKATLKVMVFQGSEQDIPGLLTFLERGVQAFQKSAAGETYILFAFNIDAHKFVVRQIDGV